MSNYLERLKAKSEQKHSAGQPSKPSKVNEPTLKVLRVTPVGVSAGAISDDGTCEFEERAAICEFDGGLPRDHAEQLAALHAVPLPEGITEQQRAIVIDAAARFLDRRRKEAGKVGAR